MDLERKRSANRLYAEKRYADARLAFQTLIRDYPDEKEGYVGLAKVLEVIGEPEDIVAALHPASTKITAFSFLTALAGAYRALFFRGLTRFADPAIEFSERALRDRFDLVTAHYLADIYATQRSYERAAAMYEACCAHSPTDSGARAKAIECFEKLGRLDKVIELRKMTPS